MKKLTGPEIHKKFLQFFEEREHLVIPSHSLIPPADDKSGLLVNSGMHPLKKYFKGEAEPPSKRLVNSQKCFRTGDLENIGDTYHHTFFFMLGNWSIGDYWKKEAVDFAWEFLVGELGLEPDKLWATYFESDLEGVPTDEETKSAWLKYLPAERVIGLGADDNFWAAGPVGPCGPCSEVYYDLGAGDGWCGKCEGPGCEKCGRYLEIWNCAVCMQYDRQEDGTLKELPFKSIDAGAGLERIAAVLQGAANNYGSDLFTPLLDKIAQLTGKKYEDHVKEFRVIADHIRAASFLIADGVRPGNLDREYILRRILRRMVRTAMKLEAPVGFLNEMVDEVIAVYGSWWPELEAARSEIKNVIAAEQETFEKTLEKGLRELHKVEQMDGQKAFWLYETYGLPLEIILDEGFEVDEKEYQSAFEEHQKKSRESMVGKFKGGIAEGGDDAKKTQYHTTAHLMLEALRRELGDHVQQKGSNITDERIRFDFSHDEKVDREVLDRVEQAVNEQIQKGQKVTMCEMPLDEAKAAGATGVFDDKYGDVVKVYTIGEPGAHFSMEICGGPHVENTSEIVGKFKIKKEQSSSAGVRRVKAVLE